MQILLLGGGGMLGSDLGIEFLNRGWLVESPSQIEFDITNPESSASMILKGVGCYDWVVNAAAYTAVDAAESDTDMAMLVNGIAPGFVAKAASTIGARTLHFSTDFVFSGEKSEPYSETDLPNPKNVYGKSKLAGEDAVREADPNSIVLRTAWLYGPNGKSFPRTIFNAWKTGKELRVVSDQKGSPTYTGELARIAADCMEKNLTPGFFHAAGPDVMSWCELAKLTLTVASDLEGHSQVPNVVPIKTSEWPTPAKRPAYSALSSAELQKSGVGPMQPTALSLREFLVRLESDRNG